jgi:hypothetical protein
MNQVQAIQAVQVIAPILKNGASFTSNILDTQGLGGGANKIRILFMIGVTDVAFTALKLQECDTSGGTYVDIAGSDYSNAAVGTLPDASADGTNVGWCLDTQAGRKRYIKIVATVGGSTATTGCYGAAIAELGRLEQTPYNAATQGFTQLVNL